MTAPSTYLRQLRDGQARRRLELARLLRDDPSANNKELAKALNVSRNTIAEDRLALMQQLNESTKTETQLLRDEQLSYLADLRDDLSNDSIKPAEKIALALGIVDRVIRLTGTEAPRKSLVGHVNGPQLDALYLDVRQVLLDVDEADRPEGLRLLQDWAKTKIKPRVLVATKFITEGTE